MFDGRGLCHATSGHSLLRISWKVQTLPGPAVGRNSLHSPFSHGKVLGQGPALALKLLQTCSSFPKDLENATPWQTHIAWGLSCLHTQ